MLVAFFFSSPQTRFRIKQKFLKQFRCINEKERERERLCEAARVCVFLLNRLPNWNQMLQIYTDISSSVATVLRTPPRIAFGHCVLCFSFPFIVCLDENLIIIIITGHFLCETNTAAPTINKIVNFLHYFEWC